MFINVRVKASSGMHKVENFGNNRYLVYLKEPAENDRANIELINLLSKYLGVAVNRMRITRGRHDKDKMIEVN